MKVNKSATFTHKVIKMKKYLKKTDTVRVIRGVRGGLDAPNDQTMSVADAAKYQQWDTCGHTMYATVSDGNGNRCYQDDNGKVYAEIIDRPEFPEYDS